MIYFAAAYLIVWAIFLSYGLILGGRLRRAERRIRSSR